MANGIDVGKAYVQIVPSAEGISGSISKIIEPEAQSAGDSGGSALGGNLVSTVKKIVVAAGLGKILGDPLHEGAALEQSVGGIETLFKVSADTVKAYASQAFRNAGVSANDYMEMATSSAAALLNSLGGDTAKAAGYTNMAITDMSDNANKFGTDMGSIQNAYAGFSKQNYTIKLMSAA